MNAGNGARKSDQRIRSAFFSLSLSLVAVVFLPFQTNGSISTICFIILSNNDLIM